MNKDIWSFACKDQQLQQELLVFSNTTCLLALHCAKMIIILEVWEGGERLLVVSEQ